METYRGYMIEVTLDGEVLKLHGTTKPSRVALAGQDHETDPLIRTDAITRTEWRSAGPLVNGRLVLHVEDAKYQVHFRRKQQEDIERLADKLGVAR